MSPQRRTALVSVGAACLLIVVKLAAGILSGSLGLLAEAAHSGTDLAAALLTFFAVSVAVGYPGGDAVAALFVAVLVIAAALRLVQRNVDPLMDQAPVTAEHDARRAIAALDPPVELRRLRVRRSGAGHFADVVIGVAPGAAVGQGHAAADR